jgi:D-serine deaminase-like pyridoxal phosphate-dependent protein
MNPTNPTMTVTPSHGAAGGRLEHPPQPNGWYMLAETESVPSPSLLVYRDRVAENLRRMIAVVGDVNRLRPHLKTHKMPDLMRLQLGLGITKFKCATIAEAEMAAGCSVPDLLLAYQPVGPNIQRLTELVRSFPQTQFSVVCDDAAAIRGLSAALGSLNPPAKSAPNPVTGVEVLLDIDIGQHRTGIQPGPDTVELYRLLAALPNLRPGGLHAYDGHIHDTDPVARAAACEAAFAPVAALRQELLDCGLPVPRLVVGGTPTFPFHARRTDVECSPGTCVFWDAGYASRLPDLDYLPAAVVLTRVVSKPGTNLLCLDLGHKAIASEMPHPRVRFLNLPDAKAVTHSEEHLVIESPQAADFKLGDCLYGLPWHICPTVALHAEAFVVQQGAVTAMWKITARERRLTI